VKRRQVVEGVVKDMLWLARANLMAMLFAFAATTTAVSASTLNGMRPNIGVNRTDWSTTVCSASVDLAAATTCATNGKKHASTAEPFKYRGFKKIWL
jgi:hypothetical protein